MSEEDETRTHTGLAHYPLKVARLPFRHLSIHKAGLSVIKSLLSDSNQRPRDYKSRALANWAKEAVYLERKTGLKPATPSLEG